MVDGLPNALQSVVPGMKLVHFLGRGFGEGGAFMVTSFFNKFTPHF